MRTILVTGATGFIGYHVVDALKKMTGGNRIIATGRNKARLEQLDVDYVVYDVSEHHADCFDRLNRPDDLIHLAWSGLPNYQAAYHIEQNLIEQYRFLKQMIRGGLKRLTISGTCFEYGMQCGCLKEEDRVQPNTIYGSAKDCLRRMLEMLGDEYDFKLKWLRLFYTYGSGQNPNSLFAQLEMAIKKGQQTFNMSLGEQLRDYLPVEVMAKYIAKIGLDRHFSGICNICSGKPVSIRRLVEEKIHRFGAHIRLNLGHYPYCDYEPMAFWGDSERLASLVRPSSKTSG